MNNYDSRMEKHSQMTGWLEFAMPTLQTGWNRKFVVYRISLELELILAKKKQEKKELLFRARPQKLLINDSPP